MVIKYPNCSIKIEAVLRYSKEEFVQTYLGRAFLKGPKQAEMLADCYDKAAMLMAQEPMGIKYHKDEDKGEAIASPEILVEEVKEETTIEEPTQEDDDSTDGSELG